MDTEKATVAKSIYAEQRASRTPDELAGATDNEKFCDAAERMILAMGRRVAGGDVEGLRALAQLREAVNRATKDAVTKLRADWDYSWADVARPLGITRQSAQERFGR
jgi:hypothetical protein